MEIGGPRIGRNLARSKARLFCPIALLYHKPILGNVRSQGNTEVKQPKFVAHRRVPPVAIKL